MIPKCPALSWARCSNAIPDMASRDIRIPGRQAANPGPSSATTRREPAAATTPVSTASRPFRSGPDRSRCGGRDEAWTLQVPAHDPADFPVLIGRVFRPTPVEQLRSTLPAGSGGITGTAGERTGAFHDNPAPCKAA